MYVGRAKQQQELTRSHVTMVGEGLERSTVVSTTAAPGSAGSWMMQAAWRGGLGALAAAGLVLEQSSLGRLLHT